MIRSYLLFLFTLLTASASLDAQNLQSAVGARLGYPVSLSYKTFLGESDDALEFTLGTRGRNFRTYSYRWITASGAYLKHKDLSLKGIDDMDGLQWYYGFGAAAYFWSYKDNDPFFDFDDSASSVSFGVQGYIGIAYTLKEMPVNLTLDWVPTVFVNGFDSGFGLGYGSLGVRYVINER